MDNYPMGVNGSHPYFNQPDPPECDPDEERREPTREERERVRRIYAETIRGMKEANAR